ncbi:glycoside hydrolase family 3 N-terminal domain-containing protein [Thermophilibacter sp.]
MSNLTRRNFLAASAAAAGIAGLAACDNSGGGDAAMTPPSSDSYPIDPDGDDVEALWTSEKVRDGWTRATNPDGGQTIGVMDPARIIQVNGLAFRDMDGDGKLSLFEDWRQSAEDRAADLASKLSGQECINLMWHGGVRTVGDGPWVEPDPEDFSALEAGSCAGCSRLYADGDSYASAVSWINEVQEICEKRAWGIPYINSTDPYRVLDIPNNIGLAALMDKDMWRKAGMWTSRVWRRTGVRVELGPQVDLYTQPTADRLDGGVTEDPILSRDFVRAFVGGMQSTWGDDDATDDQGWGGDSVGAMMKHYVGPGSIETGCDDHNIPGKYSTFPTGGFNTQLIAYLDGGMKLDSETGEMVAVMTNYGITWSEDGEYGPLRGGAYNGPQISILRNAGWDGMVCTDWSVLEDIEPLNGKPRGVEDLTMAERYRLMLDSGVDQYGERWYGDTIGTETYEGMVADMGEEDALTRVRQSARNIFKLMVNLDLFDQPYSDRSEAAEVFDSDAAGRVPKFGVSGNPAGARKGAAAP